MSYISKPNLKTRDNLDKFTNLIPLVSDINDKDGVLMEHYGLNHGFKSLKYALVKIDDKYYFIDSDNAVIEYKKSTDNNLIMCPCCYEDLSPVPNYNRTFNNKFIYVSSSFRHHKNNVECEFKNVFDSEYKGGISKLHHGEQYKHKFLKLTTCSIANSGKLFLEIPVSYEIIVDENEYSCKVDFKYEIEQVIHAETEKRILKKDNITSGLQPDIIFYTKSGRRILVEVTVGSGKTVAEYYDIWSRLNETVLELRLTDNKNIYESPIYNETIEYIKDIGLKGYNFEDNRTFRYLYSPILDNARRDIIKKKAELADLKKERGMIMELEKLQKEIKDLNSEKRSVIESIQSLKFDKDFLNESVYKLRDEKNKLKREIDSFLYNKEVELNKELKMLEYRKCSLENQIISLNDEIDETKLEYDRLVSQNSLYEKELSLLSQKVAKMEKQKISIQREIDLYGDIKDVSTNNSNKQSITIQNNKELYTVIQLKERLLELKEDGLHGDNINIKCRVVPYNNNSKLLLYDDEHIVLDVSDNIDLSKITPDTLNVLNIGIYIDGKTKKESIVYMEIKEA